MEEILKCIVRFEQPMTIIIAFAAMILDLLFIERFFNIKISKKRLIACSMIFLILKSLVTIFLRETNSRIWYIFLTITIYCLVLKSSIRKICIGQLINISVLMLLELIFSKIIDDFVGDDFRLNHYGSFKVLIYIASTVLRTAVYIPFSKTKWSIQLTEKLDKKYIFRFLTVFIIEFCAIIFCFIEIKSNMKSQFYQIHFKEVSIVAALLLLGLDDIIKISKCEELNKEINHLSVRNENLSEMFDSVRCFRHDFNNMVQVINGYAFTNNIEGIKNYSKSLAEECHCVSQLEMINNGLTDNEALDSLIVKSIKNAKEKNIKFQFSISTDFTTKNVNTYNLTRIIGILLDNAIEAAEQTEEKYVKVNMYKDIKSPRNVILIENSFANKEVSLEKLFEKGYTSKEDDNNKHGLGLWTVSKMLKKSKNLNLYTQKKNSFIQQLEIYEK